MAHSPWGQPAHGGCEHHLLAAKTALPHRKRQQQQGLCAANTDPARRKLQKKLEQETQPQVEAPTLPRLGFFLGVNKSKTGHLNTSVRSLSCDS